jgi:hypothetical protein
MIFFVSNVTTVKIFQVSIDFTDTSGGLSLIFRGGEFFFKTHKR